MFSDSDDSDIPPLEDSPPAQRTSNHLDSWPAQPAPNTNTTHTNTNSNTTTNSTKTTQPAASNDVQQELYRLLGENSILRKHLETIEKDHQKKLNDLISHHSQVKLDQKQEADTLRQNLEKERVQHDLLLKEVRMSSGSTPTPKSTNSVSSASSANSSNAVQRRQPRTSELSDGFIIKRPRLGNSHFTSETPKLTSPASRESSFRANNGTPHQIPPHQKEKEKERHERNQMEAMLPLLVSHRAPGFDQNTLEILYKKPTHVPGLSIGRDFAASETRDELVLKLLSQIELHSTNFESDDLPLLLSLLYDVLCVGSGLGGSGLGSSSSSSSSSGQGFSLETQKTAPEMLMGVLIEWLRHLPRLEPLAEVQKAGMVRTSDARRFVTVLYALDALLMMDWSFTLSPALARLAISRDPDELPILMRIGDLAERHPDPEIGRLLSQHPPKIIREADREFAGDPDGLVCQPSIQLVGTKPPNDRSECWESTELLFGGLMDYDDPSFVNLAELSRRAPPYATFVRLANSSDGFDVLIEQAKITAAGLVEANQMSWIRAAGANIGQLAGNITKLGECTGLDRGVLRSLSYALDSSRAVIYDEPSGELSGEPSGELCSIVTLAVSYFWTRQNADLRTSMSVSDLNELCVCLSQIVYAGRNTHNVLTQAQDILRDISSVEETERLMDAFMPRDQWNEADVTVDEVRMDDT